MCKNEKWLIVETLRGMQANNANRDELGQPKGQTLGGVWRAGPSSQSTVAVIRREHLAGATPDKFPRLSTRTRLIGLEVYRAIQKDIPVSMAVMIARFLAGVYGSLQTPSTNGNGKDADKQKLTKEAVDAFTLCVQEKKGPQVKVPKEAEEKLAAMVKEDGSDETTLQALLTTKEIYAFTGTEKDNLFAFAKELAGMGNPLGTLPEMLTVPKGKTKSNTPFVNWEFPRKLVLERGLRCNDDPGVDQAGMGRFSASSPEATFPGAVSVSRALTVHGADIEMDYFSAMEDLADPTKNHGAAHTGESWFTSGLYYQYMIVDLDLLWEYSGHDPETAKMMLKGWIEGFLNCIPYGKRRAMPPGAAVEYARATRTTQYPYGSPSAFFTAMEPTEYVGAGAFIKAAISALDKYQYRLAQQFGSDYAPDGVSTLTLWDDDGGTRKDFLNYCLKGLKG